MASNRGWPSGKAPGFGPGIRGFESLTPSQSDMLICLWHVGILLLSGDRGVRTTEPSGLGPPEARRVAKQGRIPHPQPFFVFFDIIDDCILNI